MIKKVLTSACVFFTVLVGGYSMLNLILYSSDPSSYLALSSLRVFLFFPFALVLAFSNCLFDVTSLDPWLRVALHFIITMVDVYLCLILPMGAIGAASRLVGMFMFLVLYAAIVATAATVRAKRRRQQNEEQDYTPVYKKPGQH